MSKEQSNRKFEETLEKLEQIVKDLEKGEMPLEENIEKFELGIKLYQDCKSKLNNIEKRVRIITEDLEEKEF